MDDMCPEGYKFINGFCRQFTPKAGSDRPRPIANLGWDDGSCNGPNQFTDNNGICETCADGTFVDPVNNRCVPSCNGPN